jgi:excisionase family DNA binding protein
MLAAVHRISSSSPAVHRAVHGRLHAIVDGHDMTTHQKAATSPPNPVREPLLDIESVAERLGVSVRHVRRLVHERRIPFVKWGHLLRFSPAALDAWIAEHTSDLGPPSAYPHASVRRPA